MNVSEKKRGRREKELERKGDYYSKRERKIER